MKQTDKELLIMDLYGKLPYKTYVKTAKGIGYVYAVNNSQLVELSVANDSEYWSEVFNIDEIKPYLRPMSSMTEEERKEIYDWLVENDVDWFDFSKLRLHEILISFDSSWLLIDWLNANHFDYRDLIEKGLAIAVTEENNPYEKDNN